MTIRRRSAYASHDHTGAVPDIARSRAGFAGQLFGHRFTYADGSVVEPYSNPFGWFVLFKIISGPRKGEIISLSLAENADRLTKLD